MTNKVLINEAQQQNKGQILKPLSDLGLNSGPLGTTYVGSTETESQRFELIKCNTWQLLV